MPRGWFGVIAAVTRRVLWRVVGKARAVAPDMFDMLRRAKRSMFAGRPAVMSVASCVDSTVSDDGDQMWQHRDSRRRGDDEGGEA